MKTKSSAKKRFKLTGTGKIKESMLLKVTFNKEKTKQKRNLTKTGLVHESDVASIKQQLCI